MDALTLVVTISAAVCAILAAKERATELSIPYICILVTMCLLASILNLRNTSLGSYLSGNTSPNSSQASGSSGINVQASGQARKVNESLYELYKPVEPPSTQIVLFHGLQPGNYFDAHLRTWQSEDGSCIWPQTWLVDAEAIPGAHVLSVSYNRGLENISHGEIDMYVIVENILSDLLQGNIGQKDYCPVILVGHSIGGLVIKQLCNQAHRMLNKRAGLEKEKLETFLNNIKCIFYYSTPHHGTSIPTKWEKHLPRALLAYFKALSKDTERLNHEFDNLDRVCNNWSFFSLGEDHATNLGQSNDRSVLVPEASARVGDFNIVNGADHFSICKPRDRLSRSFLKLKELVHRMASEAQVAKEEARALENWRPKNLQYVPKSVIGLDIQVEAIKSKLDNGRTLGLVGMGGLGKTTLAKEVFNRLASSFEYTCFIENVKKIDGDESKVIEKIGEEMYVHGKKVEKGVQERWRTKRLLLVLDDLNGVRDENVLTQMDESITSESRIIFTSRNQLLPGYSGQVHKVEILNEISAKKLFLSCAFPRRAPPKTFEGVIDAIVKKCEGLPLALNVLGKFLMTSEDSTPDNRVWEETLDAINRTYDHSDINERLWDLLRVSYDGLGEKLQQIFLDAATFFCNENWTLGEAKIAWRAAYDCHESTLWKKLVDMSLVYDVGETEHIQLHEQLQSLGRKIASEPINNNRRREWDTSEGLRLLQNVAVLQGKGTYALRVGTFNWRDWVRDDVGSEDEGTEMIKKIHIPNTAVDSLAELRYLEANVPIVVDGARDCSPCPAKLVLLTCQSPDLAEALLPALGDNIALLKMGWKRSCLPAYIGSFSRLRVLRFYSASRLESLPDEIGNLSQLQELVLTDNYRLQTLPTSFGKLSSLNHLELRYCDRLQSLPESFGNLSSLNHLEFFRCEQLQSLPESFGNLSSLNHLRFSECKLLQSLPESFGNLSSLNHLRFSECKLLQSLPESFGNLSSLNHLKFTLCEQLQSLPESFGNLSSLNHLKFNSCTQLQSLPESFGNLSSLNHLEFNSCKQLQSLPESFGNLSSLNHLEFQYCIQLQSLPESLGNLSSLNHLEFDYCQQLQSLPESFGNLSSLNHLKFKYCFKLQALQESFGNLSSLNYLRFYDCKLLQSLPESFGNLSSLNHLSFSECKLLQSLPESFGNLSSLNHLSFYYCKQLQSLPESFGNLSFLNHLELGWCDQLQSLPESFGNLSSLNHLKFTLCEQLQSLPESFGNLSSLNHLKFNSCTQLQSLPESLGNLSSLNHLEFNSCKQLQSLPESLGNLSSLNHLRFYNCEHLQSLPESFWNLSKSLNYLEFIPCEQLQSLRNTSGTSLP